MSDGLYRYWGNNLKAVREAKGWNRKAAAVKLATTEATLSRWEAGLVMPNDQRRIEVAEAYGVPPNALFPLTKVKA